MKEIIVAFFFCFVGLCIACLIFACFVSDRIEKLKDWAASLELEHSLMENTKRRAQEAERREEILKKERESFFHEYYGKDGKP